MPTKRAYAVTRGPSVASARAASASIVSRVASARPAASAASA